MPAAERSRAARLAGALGPFGWAYAAVAAAVLVAHLPFLLGIVHANPLGPRSGLATVVPGWLRGEPTIDPNNGFISQALSHRAALDWIRGDFPWWNPYSATGAPLAGETQSAAFFPPTLLTLLPGGQLLERMLLELAGGLATVALMRRLSVGAWAAGVAGVLFALNGTFAWFSHASMNPVAFLPLLLLGLEIAYARTQDGRPGGWGVLSAATALSLVAGFPETVYLDGLLVIAWAIWRLACLGRPRALAFAGKAASGAVAGALLAAPALITSTGFFGDAALGPHANGGFQDAHLAGQAFPMSVLPYVYGPIFGYADPHGTLSSTWGAVGGFLAPLLVVLAVLGLLSRGRRGLRIALAAFLVLALARIYGVPVLREVFGVLPRMGDIVFYRYAWPAVEMAVVVLAGLGLDDLLRGPARRRRVLLTAAAGAGLVVVAAVVARSLTGDLGPRYADRPYFAASVALGLVPLAVAAAAALFTRDRLRQVLVCGAVVFEAGVLFCLPMLSAPREVQTDLQPVRYLQANLGPARFFELGPLQPNYGAYWGIASLNSNDIPTQPFFDFVRRRLDPYVDPTVFVGTTAGGRNVFSPSPQTVLERRLENYRASGVRFVLVPAGLRMRRPRGAFVLVHRTPTTWIYRLRGAAPYLGAAGCAVRADGRERARVTCARPSTLVRRETALRGWRAEVDGREVPISRTAGIFQRVPLPAGTHEVRFAYRPPYVLWAIPLMALGVLWLVGAVLLRRRRRDPAG